MESEINTQNDEQALDKEMVSKGTNEETAIELDKLNDLESSLGELMDSAETENSENASVSDNAAGDSGVINEGTEPSSSASDILTPDDNSTVEAEDPIKADENNSNVEETNPLETSVENINSCTKDANEETVSTLDNINNDDVNNDQAAESTPMEVDTEELEDQETAQETTNLDETTEPDEKISDIEDKHSEPDEEDKNSESGEKDAETDKTSDETNKDSTVENINEDEEAMEHNEITDNKDDESQDTNNDKSIIADIACNDESQDESTEFVEMEPIIDKEDDKDDDQSKTDILEEDPIASDGFDCSNEDREGADEELCIIPDAERVITQEEKDAAATIPPLKDIASATDVQNSIENNASTTNIIVTRFDKDSLEACHMCSLQRKVKYSFKEDNEPQYLCDDNCLSQFKTSKNDKVSLSWEECSLRVKDFSASKDTSPVESELRTCAACTRDTLDSENNLTWEIMDFCDEFCLTKYQKDIGSQCSTCKAEVKSNSLGKYSVRFGNDIRQFCTSTCLEEYKKGLKVCSYCQQDMSEQSDGYLAPVGDKGQFKDFCTKSCMDKYDIMTNNRPPQVAPGTKCSVCKTDKPITLEFELEKSKNYFCGEPCFVAFSFVNNVSSGKCAMCKRYFTKKLLAENSMYYDNIRYSFCSNSCQNIYIIAHRKIVPCSWCKVKKYNFDMIRRYSKSSPQINMCSVNCLNLYQVSTNAVNPQKLPCHLCQKYLPPLYLLTMSDGTSKNFCSYNCVMSFQNPFPKQPIILNRLNSSGFPVPVGNARKNKKQVDINADGQLLPVITKVQSLATNGTVAQNLTPPITRSKRSKGIVTPTQQVVNNINLADVPTQTQLKQHYILKPAPFPEQKNIATMCKVRTSNKSTIMKPTMVNKEVQTDEREAEKVLIPIPVPIYVPAPMHMFTAPVPMPVPFPLPIPVPIFIPTTRNSANGIMKEIKKIQVKMPTDPYEAELLMMAEMVAGEKKEDPTDSESDVDDAGGADDGTFSPEPVDASNAFGDDMLQMALKMATELDEPAVDLEGALTANTITAPQGSEPTTEESVDDPQPIHHMMERQSLRGRKRVVRQPRPFGANKRRRRMSQNAEMPLLQAQAQPSAPSEPVEKPDANMCLKYTFGVNAWKQWVTTKNAELEKSSRIMKLFKTEILQLTADELNYSLCLFVKEVRKPNGAEYAPDTIYYLCLGIQQYLFENGRIDNIFCDTYYEKFTDCLDEVAKKFSVLYNDSHYIVTRVEEEHLWESKQLGAHSPHVLLSTLMFFNTKHFNLTTVDEHMQLSFSHIMKHWKRNPNQPGASKVPGSRNVLLRFYPPQSAIQNNIKKKKVYEQQENEENPLRCPVKLYEFYLSKCPESVKTRNDVFYLLPERSCVPDSPVWYSTMPLPREALEKMLHRVKMVKEINVALLTS